MNPWHQSEEEAGEAWWGVAKPAGLRGAEHWAGGQCGDSPSSLPFCPQSERERGRQRERRREGERRGKKKGERREKERRDRGVGESKGVGAREGKGEIERVRGRKMERMRVRVAGWVRTWRFGTPAQHC